MKAKHAQNKIEYEEEIFARGAQWMKNNLILPNTIKLIEEIRRLKYRLKLSEERRGEETKLIEKK